MKSRWSHLRDNAESLRRNGKSLPYIHKTLGVPRSTLSGWFQTIELTAKQRAVLRRNWLNGLVKARAKAALWQRAEKTARLQDIKKQVDVVLNMIDLEDGIGIELALAFLYLGEGAKSRGSTQTSLGNSNPQILKFFIKSLFVLYGIPPTNLRCYLHLRADQDPVVLKQYWSSILGIPEVNFGKISVDKRTLGSSTYPHYKGVCMVSCSGVAILRRLLYIADGFCIRFEETGG